MPSPRRGHPSVAPFSAPRDTERASSRDAQARKHAGYTDAILHGERVLIADAPRETEKGLMIRIRAALAVLPGVLVWRNNVGVDAEHGIRYGLGVGSADLVGIVTIQGVGVFLGVEVKTATGRMRPEQVRWAETVRRFGGLAITARTPEEAVAAVVAARG